MYLLLLPFLICCACNNEEEKKTAQSENDVDAARMLIRAALDGRWKEAKSFIVQDKANFEDLDVSEQQYTAFPVDKQRGHREAQIHIYGTRVVNDSTSIVTYSNTYSNQKDSLKVIKLNGRWLVDLKFNFPNSQPQ